MGYVVGQGFHSEVEVTKSDTEILEDILNAKNVKNCYSLDFLPKATAEVSIDGGEYMKMNYLSTDVHDKPIRSLRIKGTVTYDLYVKY